MLECKKITCLLAMSFYLDILYRFILRAIWAIWLLYWLEREGCHQFAFCGSGQHKGTNFHSYQEIALKWKPIFILTQFGTSMLHIVIMSSQLEYTKSESITNHHLLFFIQTLSGVRILEQISNRTDY